MSTPATTTAAPLYAGFWRRAAAACLDGLILFIPNVIIDLVTPDNLLQLLVKILVFCAYFAGFHSSRRQATPGKKAFGIKVTDDKGGRIGLGRAIARYFAHLLSVILLGIGLLMAAFTQKRQALHDLLCSTFVVNANAQPNEVVAGGGVMPVTWGVRVIVIIGLVVPAIAGFIAAIALPAYRDYNLRVKVGEVITASGPLRASVDRAISEKRAWTTLEMSIASIYATGATVTPQGEIVVHLGDDISPGGRIRFTPSTVSGGVQWKCTGEDIPKITGGNRISVPLIGVFRPIRALYPNDAETLARGRAHDHPALLAFVHLGTQFFEPCNFGRNVVGLDINVHAAFVVHALNLHAELVGRRFQHAVIAASSRMLHIDRTAQRVRPKLRGGVDIIGLAIDQQPIDARAMHAITFEPDTCGPRSGIPGATGRFVGTAFPDPKRT